MTQSTDPRGRDADTPAEMPGRGWWEALKRARKEAGDDNVGLLAAGVAFYAFLASVPLLASVVLIYGIVADPLTVMSHVQALFTSLPREAATIIGQQLASVAQQSTDKQGLGLIVAILLALYGAMRGATSIVAALNVVYDEKEKRGFIKTTLLSLVITVGAVLMIILGATAISAMAFVDRLVPGAPGIVHLLIRLGFYVLLGIGASAGIAAVYRYAPSREKARWSWLTPGSLLATLGFVGMTLGFGFYVSNFGSYNATYGALGAVVVLLMWLYLSAYVLLLGAEVNAELEHQTATDTTDGPPKPMGTRSAYVADTLPEPA